MAGRRVLFGRLRSCADVWKAGAHYPHYRHIKAQAALRTRSRAGAPHIAPTHDMARDVELISALSTMSTVFENKYRAELNV